jgi:hypothetical protein
MEKEARVNYDEDVLTIDLNEKIKDSVPVDQFIIDLSPAERAVGLEILDASKFISKISGSKIDKSSLKNIKRAYLRDFKSKELIFVVVKLLVEIDKKEEEINVQAPCLY